MHYKTKNNRHDNVVKIRLTDHQYDLVVAYANYNDLPLAVAARRFLKLGSEVVFDSDDSLLIDTSINGRDKECLK